MSSEGTGIFRKCAEWEGACCPWAYVFLTQTAKSEALAKRLGISSRVIRLWRAKVRDRSLHCERSPGCLLNTIPQHPARGPGTSSGAGGPVPQT